MFFFQQIEIFDKKYFYLEAPKYKVPKLGQKYKRMVSKEKWESIQKVHINKRWRMTAFNIYIRFLSLVPEFATI